MEPDHTARPLNTIFSLAPSAVMKYPTTTLNTLHSRQRRSETLQLEGSVLTEDFARSSSPIDPATDKYSLPGCSEAYRAVISTDTRDDRGT